MGLRSVGLAGLLLLALAAGGAAGTTAPLLYAAPGEGALDAASLCSFRAGQKEAVELTEGFWFVPRECPQPLALALAGPNKDPTIYVKAGDHASVRAGDLRLIDPTGKPPALVQRGDVDEGRTYTNLRASFTHVDQNGDNIWQASEPIYLDLDRDGRASIGDLRIHPEPTLLKPGAPGLVYTLKPLELWPCYVDDDTGGSWTQGEPVYLQTAPCGYVQPGDRRLWDTLQGPPGSTVREADRDHLNPTTPFPEQMIRHTASGILFDFDGSGTKTQGEPHATTAGLQRIQTTDNDPTTPTTLRWAFLDLDNNDRLDPGDVVYLTFHQSDHPHPGDVRLGAFLGHAFGSIVEADDLDATEPSLPPAPQGPEDGEVDNDMRKTPGVAFACAFAATAAIVMFLRRP